MAELLDKVVADLLARAAGLWRAALDDARPRSRSARPRTSSISVAGALGAVRLQACARELNAVAQADAAERVAAATRRCIAEIDAAVAFARDRRAAG